MPWAGPGYRSDLADECGRGQNSLRRRLEALGWSRLALPSPDDQSGTIAHQRAVVEIQGWSTRMRWPPSSASEHPVIGGRENADRPADYSGLPRLPCWLTNCWTAFRSLGSTVRRSSRSNRSARCAGRLGAWPTPALMTASGNLTGWAVPRVTMGVARL